MAGYGITALLCADGKSLKKGHNMWLQNQTMNSWYVANDVLNGKESVKDFLLRINAAFGVVTVDIISFNSNNNIVSVSELYPERRSEKVTAVFTRLKGALSLLTIGSKTVNEFRHSGLDFRNESKVPFLVNSNFESVNLFL